MRIALAYYGLVRPGDGSGFGSDNIDATNDSAVKWCASNMELLKSCFEGNEIDTYLFSWNCKNSKQLSEYFDNSMLMKQIDCELSRQILQNCRPGCTAANRMTAAYGEFLGPRNIIKFIENTEIPYDYIIFSRPDVRIKLDQKDWLNDHYSTHGGIDQDGKKGTGGFFGIGPAKIVNKIFNFNLADLMAIFQNSAHSESAWTQIIDLSGVEWMPYQEKLNLFQHRNNIINSK